MFGKNPIRSIVTDPARLAVEAMFYTLQGEGPYSGMPALFIRLAGCNLACHFCDTQFETQAENSRTWQDIGEEIVERFSPAQRRLVVLTGGEPMRQNWTKLADFLFVSGTRTIQIETAGTLWQDDLDKRFELGWSVQDRIIFVCSPKTPKVHQRIIDLCDHWKYVVKDGECEGDGLPDFGTQAATMSKLAPLYRASRLNKTIWLSPCDEYDLAKNQANLYYARDLCLKHGYRLSLQVHKLVNVE